MAAAAYISDPNSWTAYGADRRTPLSDDATGEDRPAQYGCSGPQHHRAGDRRKRSRRRSQWPHWRPPQHLGCRGGAQSAEDRHRGHEAQDSAFDWPRCLAWAQDSFPNPPRRDRGLRSRFVAAQRGRGGGRGGGRRRRVDICTDARRCARSALGPGCREPWRGPLGRGKVCRGQGARISKFRLARGPRGSGGPCRDCETLLRLWSGAGRHRLCSGRRVRPRAGGDLFASIRGRHRSRMRGGYACLQQRRGRPMTANVWLLRDWLRGLHGFDGVIVSDYNAIAELIRQGIAGDLIEAAAAALRAGVDIDMMSGAYAECLPQALERGLVSMDMVDAAVRRVLMLKERLGLFDDPFGRGTRPGVTGISQARRKFARELARRSITVLTNRNLLPLSPDLRRIALIGPLAEACAEMLGPWALAGEPQDAVTIREGLSAALPKSAIHCERGVAISDPDLSGIGPAREACHSADLVVLCLGEAAHMSGEAASRANPGLPGSQSALAEAVFNIAGEIGKPVAVLLSSGRPLMISALAAN